MRERGVWDEFWTTQGPDEANRLRSRGHAFATTAGAGFEPLAADFTFRDWFIHIVAVGRKPRA